ncbi:DUF7344 domain-containing protein [Natrinema salaciae]|uniref:DUF7344 domain-containing protein n=1 Tax=Natrinema salaciae TaxID=1186196 RepID=UPI000B86B196|nr:hypothetical protein [Natrinema salaciae]
MTQQQLYPREIDDLLNLIANHRRRSVLSYFRDSTADVTSVSTLANEISDQCPGDAERVARQLHHSALPRLADAGVVDYDARSNVVQYRGHTELEILLDGIADL